MSEINFENKEKLIIANCSGFFGDRLGAAKEMVRGGKIDVLMGDYLAEFTMAILYRMKLQNPDKGFVTTFLKQMEEVMGECLDNNIKIVANAGGLNPSGLVDELKKLSNELGINSKIAYIEGDDLLEKIPQLKEKGESFTHLDKGVSLENAGANPISANAYLGGWGITKALQEGADIVIGGRIADAALVSGPSAWKFKWKKDDWNKLSGAYTAGHIIECGAQATGGNYSFIDEVPSYKNMGFPIAEMYDDGSFVITKHEDTGGLVSVGTVTAQLMYEIRDPSYLTPDVISRFDSIDISQLGPDRVLVKDMVGEPPTGNLKVCINNLSGYRNSMTVVLTGLDIEKKAKIVEDTFFEEIGGKDQFDIVNVNLTRSDKENPSTNDEALAYLRISVLDSEQKKVGKLFSAKIVELALTSIPGFHLTTPPSKGTPAIQHWPTLVSSEHITQNVVVDDKEFKIEPSQKNSDYNLQQVSVIKENIYTLGETVKVPLGHAFATRSGDKGGNANLGVWSHSNEGYYFLRKVLTIEKLKELLPDTKSYDIERHEFPNLKALNFYIKGVLGEGVAASLRSDPQAKTLGEYLRAKLIEMPVSIINKMYQKG